MEVSLNPNFNLFIGDNESGKTAILEALTVAIGSFFLRIKGANARGVHKKDICIATFAHSEEYQFPVEIEVHGIIHHKSITWTRTLDTDRESDQIRNRMTSKKASAIKDISVTIDHAAHCCTKIGFPLLYLSFCWVKLQTKYLQKESKFPHHATMLSIPCRNNDSCL